MKSKGWSSGLATLVWVGVLTFAGSALADRRVALVIGNAAYVAAPPLENPAHDAADMRDKLATLGFELYGGNDLDRTAFVGALQTFGRASETADVALVFYAGHGIQADGRNYLVPIDAKVEYEPELSLVLVPFEDVLRQLNRSPNVKIVMLDACRDNPFAKTLSRTLGSRSVEALGRGLGVVQRASGTYIAYATQPDAVAQDGEGRNSPFTAALLRHMDEPGITLPEMMVEVRKSVMAATGGRQVPWDTSSLTGHFTFKSAGPVPKTSAPAAPTSAPPAADPRVTDMMAWIAAQGSNDPKDYETYLESFPKGMYARQANQRLEALRRPPVAASPIDATPVVVSPPPPVDAAAMRRERWAKVVAAGTPESYERFLQEDPDGPHAADAANTLGALLFDGPGIAHDPAAAVRWFQRGADLGSSHAANNLGNLYATGNGVPRDDLRATALYRRGADLGHPGAMTNLGIMLATGRAGFTDEAQAVALYRRAGNADGQMLLAGMLDAGRGTARDPVEAARLFLDSLRLGQPTSRQLLIAQRGKTLSVETRRAVQRRLIELQLYGGAVDGVFGASVVQGLERLTK